MKNDKKLKESTKKMTTGRKQYPEDKPLADRLKKEIDEKFSKRQDFLNQCEKVSGFNNYGGSHFYSKQELSNLFSGYKRYPRQKAEVFAKVLGVDTAYLLCYQDYKTKEDLLKEKVSLGMMDFNRSREQLVNTVTNFLCTILRYGFNYHFEGVSVGLSNSKQHNEYYYRITPNTDNSVYTITRAITSKNVSDDIPDKATMSIEKFFQQWIDYQVIWISSSNEGGARIYSFSMYKGDKYLTCNMDELMRMAFDFEVTINLRGEYWLAFMNYSLRDDLNDISNRLGDVLNKDEKVFFSENVINEREGGKN